MSKKQLATDAAIGAAAGYAATKAMEQFNTKTYRLESEEDRKREESVRPGPPFRLAAENLSQRVLGVELDEDQVSQAGMAFHYLAGLSWTPVYLLLRRTPWDPIAAGLATGASMSLILDEPSPPRSAHPHPTAPTRHPPTCGPSSPTSSTGSPWPLWSRPVGSSCETAGEELSSSSRGCGATGPRAGFGRGAFADTSCYPYGN